MLKKNIILSALFIFCINYIFGFQERAQTLKQWLSNYFSSTPTKQKKFAAAIQKSTTQNKALDLLEFYKTKEQSENFTNAKKAAKDFKDAVQKAAQNDGRMARFKTAHQQFLFGASSSSYQYEGGLDKNNATAIFYKDKDWQNEDGVRQKGLETAGQAIDFWNRYKEDMQLMKNELGINCFRLSIAWDRIQPNSQEWNMKAIAQYVEMIKTLRKYAIEPIVVLHHYTIPQWFAEIGGFEKSQNITYFVEFAKKMYEALHEHVTYWSTFNAIEGYAFKGYYTYDGPPGKEKSLPKTQAVMYNMLAAHAQIYHAIKSTEGIFFGTNGLYQQLKAKNNVSIPEPHIGIQKNIFLLDPSKKIETYKAALKTKAAIIFGPKLQNTLIFSSLRYRYYNTLDWIGVNIYSNASMMGTTREQEEAEERQTENRNYRNYPEGIYRAVKTVNDNIAKPLNIPIIITENGIATKNDTKGNEKRTLFFQRALYTIRKLIEEGCPIIGYTPWASHDNYEWPSSEKVNPEAKPQTDPYDRPYGFFHVEFDKGSPNYLKRTLKDGAHFYRDFITEYFKP